MGRKKFEEAKKKLALELYSHGLTQKQVGEILGVSQPWISSLLNRNGSRSRARRIEKDKGKDFVKLFKKGKTLAEIADLHGVCTMSVRNHLKANNIKIPNNRLVNEDIEQILMLHREEGKDALVIAKELKRDRRTVRKYINERGNNNVDEV